MLGACCIMLHYAASMLRGTALVSLMVQDGLGSMQRFAASGQSAVVREYSCCLPGYNFNPPRLRSRRRRPRRRSTEALTAAGLKIQTLGPDGLAWPGLAWPGMVWSGKVWYGTVRYGVVLCGIAWHWRGIAWHACTHAWMYAHMRCDAMRCGAVM